MKKIIYRGKYGILKHDGFRMQKLFADNRIHYILEAKNDVIDNALFISKSGNIVRDFIRSRLDLSWLSMEKYFCTERGLKCEVNDIDEEFLRNELNHSAVFVESIANGLCDQLNDDSVYTGYNNIEHVEFLYDMRAITFSPSVVWRGGIFDKNRPVYPIYIRKVSLSKMVVDWLFRMIKSGVVVTKEI